MEDTIYYDENLFYINDIINTTARGLHLDLEPTLFVDKFIEDILFVEHALSMLYSALLDEHKMVNRGEHLRRLMRTKQRFAELLDSIIRSTNGFGVRIEPFYTKFRDIAEGQRDHLMYIRESLQSTTQSETPEPDVVSEQEIMYLLGANSSEEPA